MFLFSPLPVIVEQPMDAPKTAEEQIYIHMDGGLVELCYKAKEVFEQHNKVKIEIRDLDFKIYERAERWIIRVGLKDIKKKEIFDLSIFFDKKSFKITHIGVEKQ